LSSRRWRVSATFAAAFGLALTAVPAFGDNIHNDIGASGSNTVTLSGASVSTTIRFDVQDTSGGCDVSSSTPAVYGVTLSAPASGANAAVTASPTSITFTACDVEKPVVFTATTIGKKDVTLTRVSGPTLNANPAKFTLTVNAPAVSNTAPVVTVGGVTPTAYEFGGVPAATCNVVDAEDIGESASPTYSGITGLLAAYGLGSQTATCSYTDGGGLTDIDSVTYSIVDTTDPTLDTPGDQVLEATSSAGAEATWSITGSDNVALEAPASCDVTSPHAFDLGEHTVTCSATDVAGNSVEDSFTVTVQDTTAPGIIAPSNQTVEATGPDGAVATYSAPEVSDNYDTGLVATCTPESGSTFALGETTVNCSVTDSSENTSSASFTVTVVDTTPPTVDVPADVTTEATGPDGAAVTYSVSATDLVDGALGATCDYDSGDTFPLGTTTVTCSSTDNAGNTGAATFDVTVVDTTPPTIAPHADVTAEATGSTGATVDYTAPTASDLVDGSVGVGCIPSSGVLVAVDGSQLVTCTATDNVGNTATSSFTLYVVDTTAPALTVPANINVAATSASGATVTYNATAADLVDGPVTPDCSPASGSTFAPGTTTVTCTATDAHGNTSAAQTFTVTVSFSFNGFFAPVDNNGVLNTIKGGQSVPLKWAIPNGSGGFISSLGVVSGVKQATFTCTAGAPSDDIEAPTSGATSLRYDTTANQYIYNWQSPKGANLCYKVTVYLTDGTSKSALFKTK